MRFFSRALCAVLFSFLIVSPVSAQVCLDPDDVADFQVAITVVPENAEVFSAATISLGGELENAVLPLEFSYLPEEYPLEFRRCLKVTTPVSNQELDCQSDTIANPTDPLDLSLLLNFDGSFLYPPNIRTGSFFTEMSLRSLNEPTAQQFTLSSQSVEAIVQPDILVLDLFGAPLQPGGSFPAAQEVHVLSRFLNTGITLNGQRPSLRLLSSPAQTPLFLPPQQVSDQDLYRWSAVVSLGGELCVTLFDLERCYDFAESPPDAPPPPPLVPPDDDNDSPPPPFPPGGDIPPIDPTLDLPPDAYIYPSFKLTFEDASDQSVVFQARVLPYTRDQSPQVPPESLTIALQSSQLSLTTSRFTRSASGYPILQATVPKSIDAELVFSVNFPSGPYVYHRQSVNTLTPEDITKGSGELSPVLRDLEQFLDELVLFENTTGDTVLSPRFSFSAPGRLLTRSPLLTTGITDAEYFRACFVDLQSGEVLDGSLLRTEDGKFSGPLADQSLHSGRYVFVPFLEGDAPCQELIQKWLLSQPFEPFPFLFEVSDRDFQVDIFGYQLQSSQKTSFDSNHFLATDLTDANDFLLNLDMRSPYDFPLDVRISLQGYGQIQSSLISSGQSVRLPLPAPGLEYGTHSLVISHFLPSGEVAPYVILPFEYREKSFDLLTSFQFDHTLWPWGFVLLLLVFLTGIRWYFSDTVKAIPQAIPQISSEDTPPQAPLRTLPEAPPTPPPASSDTIV